MSVRGPRERRRASSPTFRIPTLTEPLAAAAALLGGIRSGHVGACIVVDRVYAADRSHGRRRIEACVPSPEAPLHLFDARLAERSDWWRRVVFFDIETTGLSGGAGTLAFLVGCGWFEEAGFTRAPVLSRWSRQASADARRAD